MSIACREKQTTKHNNLRILFRSLLNGNNLLFLVESFKEKK